MKMKKASRKVLAMMAVTALMSGVSVVGAANLTMSGNLNMGGDPDVTVSATGEEVAASLAGQKLTGVTVEGYATSDALNHVAIQANEANNGMKKNIQDINALDNQINGKDGIVDELGDVEAKADGALKVQGNGVLYNHGTDLTTGINLNTSAIDQEVKDRKAADGVLQSQIDTNTTNIGNLDNQINGKGGLADEVEKQGYKVDTALKVEGNGVLYNHGTDLTTGINLNTSAIDQEVKDRKAADGVLQSQIDTNTTNIGNLDNQINGKGGLADEVEKQGYKVDTALKVEGNGVLYNHGTDLTTGINLNTSAIEQEVKDRETADQKLQQGITTNTAAINSVKTTVGSGVLTSGAADLTTGINQNYAQIQQNTNAINSLDSRVDDLGGEIDQVGAVSAALAGLHPLDYDGTGSKFQLSAAMGSYDSSQAAAIGAFYHFNRDVMISLGGATSFDGDHKTAGNLGVTFRIGEGASGSAVSDDVMARLEAMDQKIAALEQENKDLKNVLGTIDTSLSKEFPDVPANHWAYEAVTKLAGNDVVAGYPDGEFHGDRTMTRYEMAEIIYKAMSKGVQVDQKLVEEFKPEMEQVAANQNA